MPEAPAAHLHSTQLSHVGSNLPPLHLKCFTRNGRLNKYSLGEKESLGLKLDWPAFWVGSLILQVSLKSWILANHCSGKIMIKSSSVRRHKRPNRHFVCSMQTPKGNPRWKGKPGRQRLLKGRGLLQMGFEFSMWGVGTGVVVVDDISKVKCWVCWFLCSKLTFVTGAPWKAISTK